MHEKLYRYAQAAKEATIQVERIGAQEHKKPWVDWGRKLKGYEKSLANEGINVDLLEIITTTRESQGQLVLLDIGSNHNPLPKKEQRKDDIVVSIGLQEWRKEEHVKKDAEDGFFFIEGSIGLPETFLNLHALLDSLHDHGRMHVNGPNVILGLIRGGWISIPLVPALSIRPDVSEREYEVYQDWLGENIRSVTSVKGATIVMDVPEVGDISHFINALKGSQGEFEKGFAALKVKLPDASV